MRKGTASAMPTTRSTSWGVASDRHARTLTPASARESRPSDTALTFPSVSSVCNSS